MIRATISKDGEKMKIPNIGIITMPITKSGLTPLSNMINIIYSIYGTFFLITGDAGYDCYKEDSKVKIYRISHYETEFFLTTNEIELTATLSRSKTLVRLFTSIIGFASSIFRLCPFRPAQRLSHGRFVQTTLNSPKYLVILYCN